MTDHDVREVEALADIIAKNEDDFGYIATSNRQRLARMILTREARLVDGVDKLRLEVIKATHTLGGAALGTISVPSTLVARVNVSLTTAVAEWHRLLAAHRAATKPSEPERPVTLAEAVEAMLVSAPQVVFGTAPVTHEPLDADGVRLSLVRPAALEAVRAALARERSQVTP